MKISLVVKEHLLMCIYIIIIMSKTLLKGVGAHKGCVFHLFMVFYLCVTLLHIKSDFQNSRNNLFKICHT